MTQRLPDFLIVGAMRSGTTSLSVYLSAHRQVFIPPQKEIRFFDRHYEKGLDWYQQQFRGADKEVVVGEASPGYMYFPKAVDRLGDALPNARLIAILRDPVDRAYSHYWMNRSLGIEPLSFSEAVDRESERLSRGERPADYSYVDRGRYLRQLSRLCERYPRQRLHVLLFEDLARSPKDAYLAVCEFLGINEGDTPNMIGAAINRFVTFRSRGLRGTARRLPPLVRRAVERVNTRLNDSYPPMAESLRSRLLQEFRRDNNSLGEWLGRDLSAWGC